MINNSAIGSLFIKNITKLLPQIKTGKIIPKSWRRGSHPAVAALKTFLSLSDQNPSPSLPLSFFLLTQKECRHAAVKHLCSLDCSGQILFPSSLKYAELCQQRTCPPVPSLAEKQTCLSLRPRFYISRAETHCDFKYRWSVCGFASHVTRRQPGTLNRSWAAPLIA